MYVCVEGRDSQTLHWWLFSWFIIINHCNDSFIQLVVTCVSGKICAAVSAANLYDKYQLDRPPSGGEMGNVQDRQEAPSAEM